MTVALREFRLPDLGEGLTESEIVAWKVAAGDHIELNQVIAEVETAKAVVDLPSPFAGVVAQLMVEAGVVVSVGAPIISFEVADAAGATGDDAEAAPPNLVGYGAAPESTSGRRPRNFGSERVEAPVAAETVTAPATAPVTRRRAAPPVRLLARQLGISLDDVEGTGDKGLITRSDLEKAGGSPARVGTRAASTDDSTLIPVSGVRKLTAQAMVASAFTAPHVTVFMQLDVTP
ncbi:MAG: biotin/lipoyl-containing protein, partial [Pseudolysinimonas sp.]